MLRRCSVIWLEMNLSETGGTTWMTVSSCVSFRQKAVVDPVAGLPGCSCCCHRPQIQMQEDPRPHRCVYKQIAPRKRRPILTFR